MDATTDNGNGENSAVATENRRQWPRKPSDVSEVTVVQGSKSQVAMVVDESLGGIGIKMAEASNIVRGDQLKLLYHGIPVPAVVRRLQAEDDSHRIGLEWLSTHRVQPKGTNKQPRESTATFLSFSGFRVACRVEDMCCGDSLQAKLPDGSTCRVQSADLLTRTIADRQAELESLTLDLTMLAGVYQLGEQPSKQARIEAILDFEFRRVHKPATEFVEQIRSQNRTILNQSQRIEELESYLNCIVTLTSKIKELELEIDGAL